MRPLSSQCRDGAARVGSATAGPGGAGRRGRGCQRAVRGPPSVGSGRRRDVDLPVDDLLTVVVDLVLDVVDLTAGGGQADAVGGQVVDDVLAGLDVTLGEAGDERLD